MVQTSFLEEQQSVGYVPIFLALEFLGTNLAPASSIPHAGRATKLALASRLPPAKLLVHLAHLDLARFVRGLVLQLPLLLSDLSWGLGSGYGCEWAGVGDGGAVTLGDGLQVDGAPVLLGLPLRPLAGRKRVVVEVVFPVTLEPYWRQTSDE